MWQCGNAFLFAQVEKKDDYGIGMYDHSARFMDPSIGKFIAVDALARLLVSSNR